MNQKCKVCDEPAAGFHFGAFTCEGCKSFFGRSYNNLGAISECKNHGMCVINKKNRTSCKACRLRKCMEMGMSKSGSRYGRRSNWFKIHCLLQEQQQAAIASLRGKPPPDQGFAVPYPPPFLLPETSSSSPDSERSEKSPPSFLPMHFPPMFLRPPHFLIHPQMFPYPTPPIKPEPSYPPSEEEPHCKTLLNNNNYDSKNNNIEKDPKRFYLDAILGFKKERSCSPPINVSEEEEEEEEQESEMQQDVPIDLSVRSSAGTKNSDSDNEETKKTVRAFSAEEAKPIPLDLSV